MNGTIYRLAVPCVALLIAVGGCSRESARKAAAKAASAAKDTAAGIAEGVEDARKKTASPDGAVIISTDAEMTKAADVAVLAVLPGPDSSGATVVELAITNRLDTPLRLTGLHKTGQFTVVDKEGFSHPIKEDHPFDEHTILPKAKQKISLRFDAEAAKIAKVVFYGRPYPVDPKLLPAATTAPVK
jgi:hypothetical protein